MAPQDKAQRAKELRQQGHSYSQIATQLGNPLAGCFVLIAAYARITGLVGIDALVEGMRESVPPYRQQHIAANEKALRTGFESAPPLAAPAWKEPMR